jgi:RNA polymerase sigma factor (sigma-70 family)
MESLSDHEIISRVLDGKTRSFADLVERHKDKAMTLAMRMLRNREEAEEAVQDAFVRAFNALGQVRETVNILDMAVSDFIQCLLDYLIEARGTNAVDLFRQNEGKSEDEIPDFSEIPDSIVEGEEFRRQVIEALNELPPLYSGIATMFYLDDLSYEEIVTITGSPLGTVKARLFRARAMLRDGIVRRIGTEELAR